MGCQSWTSSDQPWLCKWWTGKQENSLGETLRPSFISLGCKDLNKCLSTTASSKERQWETPNPHLSYAVGLSVSFKVAFWSLALWGRNSRTEQHLRPHKEGSSLPWEHDVSSGSCILPLFYLSWLSLHPALCWNSLTPKISLPKSRLRTANSEPLKLWHFEISFSFLTLERERERERSCHILLMFCFPRQWGCWSASSPCSSSLLPTAVDPTYLVHIGKISFKLGLESCSEWHVGFSRVSLRPIESQFIESFFLSKRENWMGLCSATWCWGWYGNKGSKNDETQIIFSCVINSCVKLLWKLSSKLG